MTGCGACGLQARRVPRVRRRAGELTAMPTTRLVAPHPRPSQLRTETMCTYRRLVLDAEVVWIVGRSGGKYKLIRGAEDTTPAAHDAGEYPDATLHVIDCAELTALREGVS